MSQSSSSRDIVVSTLSNGIRVITEPMPAVRSVAAGIWVGAGSRAEKPGENGISHFIEHMLFKGTMRRGAEDIAREVDALGGQIDAFTGRELAGYTIKVLDQHLPAAFDILADMLLEPRFDADDIEKEKGVILEELKMETDSPESLVHDLFFANFWKRHPLGRPIIGSRRTIQSFERGVLREFHASIYTAANLTITAAGNLNHEAVAALAERYFGGLRAAGEPRRLTAPHPRAAITLKNKRSLQQVQVCVGAPCHPVNHPLRYAGYTLNVILGASMSSRLFQNIRERQGLAYNIYSELQLYQDSGCLAVYAGTSPENVRPLLESVLREFRRVKEEALPEDELRHAKEHMKGSLLLSLEGTTSRMSNLARQWLNFERFFTLDEIAEAIDRVTAEEVRQVAREFLQSEKLALTLLGRIGDAPVTRDGLAC
jgi:predicted Zn-dependent peptidase